MQSSENRPKIRGSAITRRSRHFVQPHGCACTLYLVSSIYCCRLGRARAFHTSYTPTSNIMAVSNGSDLRWYVCCHEWGVLYNAETWTIHFKARSSGEGAG